VVSGDTTWWISALYQTFIVAMVLVIVVRFGLLVLAVSLAAGDILTNAPLTASWSHWMATTSNAALGLVLATACFGFYASRAGQPLLGDIQSRL